MANCIRPLRLSTSVLLNTTTNLILDRPAVGITWWCHGGPGTGLEGAGERRWRTAQTAATGVAVEPHDVADVVGRVTELALRHRWECGEETSNAQPAGVLSTGGLAGLQTFEVVLVSSASTVQELFASSAGHVEEISRH